MRRVVLALGTAALLAAAILACEEDPAGGGNNFLLDASSPGFDASLPPGVDAATPDAADAGDAGDASRDASVSTVTVTATDFAGPKAGVRVVFHDAAGAVLETKLTGANGKATSSGPLPAMATAILGTAQGRRVVTWTGVESGDDLAVRDVEPEDTLLGTYEVTLPANTGASFFEVFTGNCSGSSEGGTATLDVYRSCSRATNSVLVRGFGSGPIGHGFKKGNAPPVGGAAVPVTVATVQATSGLDVTVANVSVNAFALVDLLEVSENNGFPHGEGQSLDGDTASFEVATGFAEALQATVRIYEGGGGGGRFITKRVAPAPSVSFDAAEALPPMTGTTVAASDPRRPELSWSSTVPMPNTDGGLVRVRFSVPDVGTHEWTFVVPPGSTSVTAPAMPPEADFLPAADAGVGPLFHAPTVAFIEADVLPSYALFRNQQGALVSLDQSIGDLVLPALPINGTYRATMWFGNTR